MVYNKMKTESLKDYKKRLCMNKSIYGLTFQNIADLINRESGENKSESTIRKWWSAYNEGYLDAEKENIDNDEILKQYEEKRIEAEKARVRFFDQRTSYNKIIREQARNDELKELIVKSITKIQPYQQYEYRPQTNNYNNDMIVCLDDIHYGANIDNYWNKYNSEVAKERMEKYLLKIIEIQNTNKCQNCYVMNNGDSISGSIHTSIKVSNKENLIEQVMGVSELISWFLAELSVIFENVYYSSVGGNHSRIDSKKDALKGERLDSLIPWYIKARLSNIDNVTILDNDIDNTFNIVNIKGLNYLNVHGDYDDFGNIDKIVNMINAPIYGIHMGHKHHNKTETIGNYKAIMSGSFQGMDDFCIEKRILGKAEQLICICNSNGIDCMYNAVLQ